MSQAISNTSRRAKRQSGEMGSTSTEKDKRTRVPLVDVTNNLKPLLDPTKPKDATKPVDGDARGTRQDEENIPSISLARRPSSLQGRFSSTTTAMTSLSVEEEKPATKDGDLPAGFTQIKMDTDEPATTAAATASYPPVISPGLTSLVGSGEILDPYSSSSGGHTSRDGKSGAIKVSSVFSPLPPDARAKGVTSRGSEGTEELKEGAASATSGSTSSEAKMSTDDDSEGHPSSQGILSWHDPLNQYTETVYSELKNNELKYRPKADYMETIQKDINHTMRGILVDWLVEVGEEYKLSSQTLFLTVKYIDRLLSVVSVHRTKLQLVGITCMLLASKYEEIYPPSVDDFVYISDNTYSRDEVLRMETVLLNSLKFALTNATCWEFARRFSAACGLDKRCTALANYITEAFLQESQYLKFLPSHIGAAAVFLSLHMTKQKPWPRKLESASGFAFSEIKDCVTALHQTITRLSNGTCQLKAVKNKYSEPKHHRVALIPPTDLPTIV